MTRTLPFTGPVPARRAARERGFTLLEVMFAFAIMAVFTSVMMGVEASCVRKAEKALEYRDTAVMADTVFRRVVYEGNQHWPEGHSSTADISYAEYIGLKGVARDRWSNYKILIHRKRGMIAGSDPSGRLENLFEGGAAGQPDTNTTGTGTSTETTASGEQAWLVTMEVFWGDDLVNPVHTLRSILPLQPEEEEEAPR
jgi:prepilin-type N-terminal cleavage/methylation domain-containing protein